SGGVRAADIRPRRRSQRAGARLAGAKRRGTRRRRANRQGRHSRSGFGRVCLGERPAARESRVAGAIGPAERHRHGHARLCRSAATDVSRQRQACDRARHLDARGRQRSRSRRQHQAGDDFDHERPADRDRADTGGGSAVRRVPRRRRLHAIPGGGAGHRDCDQLLKSGIAGGRRGGLVDPVVLATVFIFMDWADIALQRVSLGALIISLGLLVDDAMITVEMMIRKLEEGWTKSKAATHAYMTTHFPMGTGTLVTVAAFLPIGMARSSAGEDLFPLFAVVAVALIASWFVAAIFTPLLGMVLLSEKHSTRHEPGRMMRAFRTVLLLCMRWRRATVALACVALALAIVGLAFVPRQFFPSADRPELFVDMQLPQNASIAATEKAVSELEPLLRDDPDIERWSI